jgi:hypothetical protein
MPNKCLIEPGWDLRGAAGVQTADALREARRSPGSRCMGSSLHQTAHLARICAARPVNIRVQLVECGGAAIGVALFIGSSTTGHNPYAGMLEKAAANPVDDELHGEGGENHAG